jgi:hypothetical protein
MSKKRSKYYEESELAIAYVVLSRLMKEAKDTDAFKLGLINEKYKLLRHPETDAELEALSPLWILIFKLKRALGTRLISIFKYMYLKNFDSDDIINKLAVMGTIKTRNEITLISRDMKNKDLRSLK